MPTQLPQIPFGSRSGFSIPRVNIGGMRLPEKMDEAVMLLRYAIDHGLKYIDTCLCYGDSELKLAQALKDGYREKVILSTKWSPWNKKFATDDDASADRVLLRMQDSMKRLEVKYLDFYQVWNHHSRDTLEQSVRKGGFVDGLREARKRGLIGHIGVTTHAPAEELLISLDEMDWCEVLLVSYNMLSTPYAPVLAKAKSLGIGTIVMNPVSGGKLSEESPVFAPLVKEMGATSLVDLAVRYVLSNPNVDTIISGISRIGDVDGSIASSLKPPLSTDQIRKIDGFVKSLTPANVRFCTACGYCMPCPQKVNIPKVMESIYNERILKLPRAGRQHYDYIGLEWMPGMKADACTACGECAPKCTQKLNIPGEMEYANKAFAG